MEITVYDYAAQYGVTRRTAAEWLDDRVRLGMLKKTKKKINNRWLSVYSEVKSGHEHTGRGNHRGRSDRRRALLPVG